MVAKVVCREVLKLEKCNLGQIGPTGKAVHFCKYTKGPEKTEFAPPLTFPEAKQLSGCQASSERIYDRASKINQWRNDVNIGGRKKAQKLEEGKYCKILKHT